MRCSLTADWRRVWVSSLGALTDGAVREAKEWAADWPPSLLSHFSPPDTFTSSSSARPVETADFSARALL